MRLLKAKFVETRLFYALLFAHNNMTAASKLFSITNGGFFSIASFFQKVLFEPPLIPNNAVQFLLSKPHAIFANLRSYHLTEIMNECTLNGRLLS